MAYRVTAWLGVLKVTLWAAASTLVLARVMLSLWVLSLLATKLPEPE